MFKNSKSKLALFLLTTILFSNQLIAQAAAQDFMRSTGKIYVVVAVIVLIFIGVVLYLIRLDSKISKLEKIIKEHGES